MRQVALITGITGQDGSYLAEHLLCLGYEVHGLVRRNSAGGVLNRLEHIQRQLHLHTGDLLDYSSLMRIVHEVKPHEVYNLAAQSHVHTSFEQPTLTLTTNAVAAVNLLEICRKFNPSIRFYQASSSEMFGNSIDPDGFQRETTPMCPVNPYGHSKLFTYSMVKYYREHHGMFAVNGICFNHESPRRGLDFVTNKVIHAACAIRYGGQRTLDLGDLHAARDWGHARDYVSAMHAMMCHDPDDYVVATGVTHTVEELCQHVFAMLGLDYTQYVVVNQSLIRPKELTFLRGDASKAREKLHWSPSYDFTMLLEDMLNACMSGEIR